MRLQTVRSKLEEHNLDALLVSSWSNIFYLSGFTGSSALLFITAENSILLTDFRYTEQAEEETQDFEIVRIDSYPDTIAGLAQDYTRIGVEEEELSLIDYRKFQTALHSCQLVDSSNILTKIRQIKDESEIHILRQIISMTDQAFLQIAKMIQPGMTEVEISLELEFSLRKMGATDRSFDYIVASGLRSSLPHGVATEKKLEKNESLTLDYGGKYKGYCSDLTRTVFLGQPDSKQREIYNIVLEAQQAGIEALKPGITGQEADAVARQVMTKAGYGEYFGHGLGHALGIEVHETPRLNTRETQILQPGMVITVEPGIYIPGWGGVRIEDVILVNDNGVEVLTQAPKQFIIID
ncbi:MAG: Xaa-Pro dipeptidase [Gracilibacter sp. BRH_c7a]|nr:MAG: Xaa-Pro dipeptidase [Gracilibacter sp. BRH_c7a]